MKPFPKRMNRDAQDIQNTSKVRKMQSAECKIQSAKWIGSRLAFCVLHSAFFMASFGFVSGAESEQKVGVSGRVVNRTRNVPVAGQEVTLVRHREAAAAQVKAVTGADGAFQFTNVAVDDSASLALMTSYLGAPYVVSGVTAKGGSGVEVAVYDTVSSDADVRADAYHLIVNAHGASLDVMEILAVRNEGERTVYGPDGVSLRVPLPSGFSGLEVASASVETPEGFASRWPILPGEARLRFRYKLSVGDVFSRVVPLPASMVSVLVHPAEVSVESRSLQFQGPVDFEGQRFLHLTGANLARGSVIDFRVTARGAGGAHPPESPDGRWREALKWVLLGLAAVTGAAAFFYRPKKRRTADGGRQTDDQGVEQGGSTVIHRRAGEDVKKLEAQREETLGQIAALDDDREAGRVDEATHQKRRAALKAEAVRLTEALREWDA